MLRTILYLILLIGGSYSQVFATHIVGGVLNYECQGQDPATGDVTLRLTLKVYRDCFNGSAGFDNPANLTIFNGGAPGSTNATFNQNIQLFSPIITDVPPVLSNPCLVPPANICVEEGVYTTIITLPQNTQGYYISYQRCCRNNTISNITNPGGSGSTYGIYISPQALSSCNSSPVFDNFPPIIICEGEPLIFDHKATDKDGNRLEYELCTPLLGASRLNPAPPTSSAPPYTSVVYAPGYFAGFPMASNPALSIDANTGMLTGTPLLTGQYVVGVCVSEYDNNGNLVGSVLRDFQFNVEPCTNVVNAQIQNSGIDPSSGAYLVNTCNVNTIRFVNQSTDQAFITDYYWEFDLQNGNTATSTQKNPVITFPGPNTYTGILVANPGQVGCTDTAIISVTVFPEINSDFTMAIDSCNPNDIALKLNSTSTVGGSNTIVDYDWTFSDGTTDVGAAVNHIFPSPGQYTVKLRVTDNNGCTDVITKNVDWYPAATPSFTSSGPAGCRPASIPLVNTSQQFSASLYTSIWDFGDGSPPFVGTNPPAHVYPGAGLYDIRLQVVSPWGCTTQTVIPNFVEVYELPIAHFGSSADDCTYQPVQFTDSSQLTSGTSFLDWNWDFGDGATATAQNPNHLYANAGSYEVMLEVTDNNGCQDRDTLAIDWFPSSNIQLATSFSGCQFDSLQITNFSFPDTGYTHFWSWGDGTTDTIAEPAHAYAGPGTYNAQYVITSPTGCTSTFDTTYFVRNIPTARFRSSYDSCVIDSVIFTDLSTPNPSNDPIVQWIWDFKDGATSSLQNPKHFYVTAGTYAAELTVVDVFGCEDSFEDSIRWYPAPVIDVQIASSEVCAPEAVFFNNQSYPINGYSTLWDFGDGFTDTAASPTHIYRTPGVYEVNLLITSPTGCQETFKDTITVHERPRANFSYSSDSCKVEPVQFTDLSATNSANTPLTSWYWTFDDGNDSTDRNPLHLYDTAGIYNVKLVVADTNGCTDTIARNVNWNPAPIVAVAVSDSVGCEPLTVDFINTSYPINGYSTVWNFGDGVSSTDASPSHTFTPGVWEVNLLITSPSGCQETYLDTIEVFENPKANFSFTFDSCAVDSVYFTDLSVTNTAGTPLRSWNWSFGDGANSTLASPGHKYALGNTYTAQLIVQDTNACVDTAFQTIDYDPSPVFEVGSNTQNICFGESVIFKNNPSNNVPSYTQLWTFGDGTTSSDFEPTHTYTQPGTYFVSLTVNTPTQCTRIFLDTVFVRAIPIANFSYSYDSCTLDPVKFKDQTQSSDGKITVWNWTFGDGSSDTVQHPKHTYIDTLVFSTTLNVSTEYGCTHDTTLQVRWKPKPVYPVTLTDTRGCSPETPTIPTTPYPLHGYTTRWEFGDGRVSTEGQPDPITYEVPNTYTRRLFVESPLGCKATFQSTHEVLFTPTANFSYTPDALSNFDSEASFTDASIGAAAWKWDFGTNETLPGIPFQQNPTYTYADTGRYQVRLTVTHRNGCTDDTTQWLDIVPRFTYFVPNAFTPNGDGKNEGFRGTGIMNYITDFNMQIFNRWGERVFQTNDPYEAWNGRKNNTGERCKAGVYVYQIRLQGGRGRKEELKGFATLIY